jgi:Tol biopolymer transport system component/DNA-binding winged helix-turn-helix (wHTH) protein
VDTRAGELRKGDATAQLQEQPLQILLMLLGHPGELVTREELRKALWTGDTFVDYEDSLNHAIRRLRDVLGDSADKPRFIETLPRRGYRFIAPVERPAPDAARPQGAASTGSAVERRSRQLLWALGAGIVVIAGAGVAWWWLPRPSGTSELALTQLTTDTGLTYQPALSPDGKLVGYASDRSGDGNLDIWVQQVPRGEPIRVTHDEADDYEPSFSPDGRSIVFRSDRAGGGIYVVSTLGGEARKIVEKGRQPRYSPNGAWIAYWVGRRDRGGRLYVVPSAGGQPKGLGSLAHSPVWTPDGKHLLFRAMFTAEEWCVVPLDGGPAVTTGVGKLLQRRGFSLGIEFPALLRADPVLWLAEGNFVVFSGKKGDSTGLWKIPISLKTWQVAGEPQRLTFGTGIYTGASASAGGRLVFSSLTRNPEIWSLAVDAGEAASEMQQLTHDAADDVGPSVSADGERMVFESNRTGKRVVWNKDLETGRIKALTDTPSSENLPVISADGSQVAYVITSFPDYKYEMYEIAFEGGPSKKICDTCGQPLQWSFDKMKVLVAMNEEKDLPPHLAWLDSQTGQKVKLAQHPKYPIWEGSLSPDERWIAFGVKTQRVEQFQWFIAPLHDGAAVSESTWIPIDGEQVRWSTDVNLLYIISEQDGFPCLYAQRLDHQTKRPAGALQPVHHFHSARHSVIEDPAWRWSIARDKIVVTLVDLTGNIWMAEPQGR